MANDLSTRIAVRNATSDAQLERQGPFRQLLNRAGLVTANAADRVDTYAGGSRRIFLGMTMFGAARGAFYGAVAGAILGLGNPLVVIAFAIAGAVGFGMHDGQKGLEEQMAQKPLADRIAEKTGVVPKQKIVITKSPQDTLAIAGHDRTLDARINAALKQSDNNDPSFVAREDARRAKPRIMQQE